MTRYARRDIVTPDAEELRRALDGRTQVWLAQKVGIDKRTLNAILKGRQRTRRSTYERMRAVLPALPPLDGHKDEPAANIAD